MADEDETRRLEVPDSDQAPSDAAEAPAGDEPAPADASPGRRRPDPLAAVKDPDTRAKLLVAIAALSAVNLLLLLVLLFGDAGGDGPQEVMVENEPCIVVEQDGENMLYCAR